MAPKRSTKHLPSFVYFARCGDFVKIGHSTDHTARVRHIQVCNPVDVELVTSEPGGSAREAWLHAEFRHLNTRGEWYLFEGKLKTYIENRIKNKEAEDRLSRQRAIASLAIALEQNRSEEC